MSTKSGATRSNKLNSEKEPKKMIKISRRIFDLNTFEEMTLVKSCPDPAPATSVEDVMARIGGDTSKLMSILNKGLVELTREELKNNDSVPEMVENEDGTLAAVENVQPADMGAVNNVVLTLAKTVFGFKNPRDAKPEEKEAVRVANRQSKEKALEFIKGNDTLKAGLIASAATAE